MPEEEKQRMIKVFDDYQRQNPADRTAAMAAIQGQSPEQPIEQKPTQGKPYDEQLQEIARNARKSGDYKPTTKEEAFRNAAINAANRVAQVGNIMLPAVSVGDALQAAQRRKVQGAANTGGVIGEAAEEQAQEQLKKKRTIFDDAREAK